MIGVLIVEDERIVALALERALRRMRYSVTGITDSGEEAVRKAAQTQPDLVLMDIRLSGEMDGIEAAAEIQARFDIPVIYLTAYADEKTLQRAKVTAAFGYVLKPFEERELRVAIEMALYKHGSEQRLKERERWLAATLNSIREAVITANDRGLVTLVNQAAEDLSGWQQQDAWGKPLTQVLRIEDGRGRPVTAKAIRQANREANSADLSNRLLICKDGARKPIDCTITPIRDERGRPCGTVAVVRDLSELQKAEAALSDSQDRYDVLLETSADAILLLQLDGTIVDCNSKMAETIGLSRQEVIGLSLGELAIMPTDLLPKHSELLARLSRGEQLPPFQMRFDDHTGRPRTLEMSVAPLTRRGKVYAIQIIGHSVDAAAGGSGSQFVV
jgi:PAS domain S-box-containing protein